MYCSTKTTREKALVAAAAAERACQRNASSKSQFKFKCFSCGEFINRGDNITRCYVSSPDAMELRYRGADTTHGLEWEEVCFYRPETGAKQWVHVGCNPCFWDSLPEHCNEWSRPSLRPITTDWGLKVRDEFHQFLDDTGQMFASIPTFSIMRGYPAEKDMMDRIIRAVTQFQALWRGYIYKKAYPIARLDAIATQTINKTGRVTLCVQEVPDLITQRQREADSYGNKFYRENRKTEGTSTAILFDRGRRNEAVYSCKILKIAGEHDAVHVYVEFHDDGERRKYHWRKFVNLQKECEDFMRTKGIHCTFIGKIYTNLHKK